MQKMYTKLSEDNRSITITYKVTENDKKIFHAITDIVRENGLACTLGEDDFHTRYFYIIGVKAEKVMKAFKSIEELNI